ncbi:hypothetical protein GG344DRAFT_54473 [Lentinula edodes]|nr:hypothetical protein GG344DRAFT_54473 [Lentinula edodes]
MRSYSACHGSPGLIFLSGLGQTLLDKNGRLVEGGIKEHTVSSYDLGNILSAAGSSSAWEKVVKVNIYLKSMNNLSAMNEVYEKDRMIPKPARTCIQAGKLLND